MSNSVQPHRWQPTRLPCPWDSPGKNTGVGCHFLLQCVKEKSESEVAQLCPTLSDPMDCSLPGSSVHGICQARVLEWGASAFSEIKLWVTTNPTVRTLYGTTASYSVASLVAQTVKNLPAMWETGVRSLGWEALLKDGMATHSSMLAWRIPSTDHGVTKSRTRLSDL